MRNRITSLTAIERRMTRLSRGSSAIPRVIVVEDGETFQDALIRTCKALNVDPADVGPVAVLPAVQSTVEQWVAKYVVKPELRGDSARYSGVCAPARET